MSSTEKKLAQSLTAESVELIPYLPYLLQDLWELGSSPEDIIEMIQREIAEPEKLKVLDFACGKGAVSVNLAKALGCRVKGIDMIPEFIEVAKEKATVYKVENLCEFIVGDAKEAVEIEKNYDLVIFGAAGDILGTPEQTIQVLKKTITPQGYLIIDDAYGKEGNSSDYYTRAQWLEIFTKTGVTLLDEKRMDPKAMEALNKEQQSHILKRSEELKKQYPEKKHLFDGYVKSQQAECDELENDLDAVTLLLRGTP